MTGFCAGISSAQLSEVGSVGGTPCVAVVVPSTSAFSTSTHPSAVVEADMFDPWLSHFNWAMGFAASLPTADWLGAEEISSGCEVPEVEKPLVVGPCWAAKEGSWSSVIPALAMVGSVTALVSAADADSVAWVSSVHPSVAGGM